ncbi:MAG: BamA/TamA family outer membrane protein, partial [Spirochaetota bacterium]
LFWDHSFSSIEDPSGNSPDSVLIEKNLGILEKRALKLSLARNTMDNSLNPTKGTRAVFSTSVVGGYLLRGDSHYLKYEPGFEAYYTPFHVPFIDDYPCVFQIRASGDFLAPPLQKSKIQEIQDRYANDWLKSDDRLLIGGPPGYGTDGVLRGWDPYSDPLPTSWQNGLYHQITYGAEFRFPVHPQYLWVVFFFDAGSLWTDKFWEQTKSEAERAVLEADKESGLVYDIRDIGQADLMGYFRYSYGVGFKIQIPMMPLRFWFGKKLLWNGEWDKPFTKVGGFDFQFAIGDASF